MDRTRSNKIKPEEILKVWTERSQGFAFPSVFYISFEHVKCVQCHKAQRPHQRKLFSPTILVCYFWTEVRISKFPTGKFSPNALRRSIFDLESLRNLASPLTRTQSSRTWRHSQLRVLTSGSNGTQQKSVPEFLKHFSSSPTFTSVSDLHRHETHWHDSYLVASLLHV